MCGIVGSVGDRDIRTYLFNGLKSLEYRGYDSAGVALVSNNELKIFKNVGRVEKLKEIVKNDDYFPIGIGHTRWATHGKVSIENSHPHSSNKGYFTLVHNGVIENHLKLKQELLEKKYHFYSETDSEIIANIIEDEYLKANDVLLALENSLKKIKGSISLVIIFKQEYEKLYFIKRKSPLLIGVSNDANYLASDALPMIKKSDRFIDINDDCYGYITSNDVMIFKNGKTVKYKYITKNAELLNDELNGYPHYMLKEIEEIPNCINRLIDNYYLNDNYSFDSQMLAKIKDASHIIFLACGTSYHACLVAKQYMDAIGKNCEVLVASEWAYFPTFKSKNTVFILLSQSGETADLIRCLNVIKQNNCVSIAITNSKGSTLERQTDYSMLLYAGIEIAVASTKAYVAQVALLYLLKGAIVNDKNAVLMLKQNNNILNKIKDLKNDIRKIAKEIYKHKDAYFLGKGSDYFVCKEASLKLKEITYIHSEAFPSGELKHGPIALVEKNTPVFGFLTIAKVNEIVRNNFEEVLARGAKLYSISTRSLSKKSDSIIIDDVNEEISCLALAMISQYLAYYTALEKGTDIDKPRNLAKSVTVE